MLEEGRRRRDDGQRLVGENVDADWRADAERWVAAAIRSGVAFSANELIEAVGSPDRPNAVGSIFGTVARAGLIEPVGYTQGRRSSQHARRLIVWRRSRFSVDRPALTERTLP